MTEFVDRNDAGNIDFAERIAPIEAAPPAPESFDATAAIRRVLALAEKLGDESREYYYENRYTHEQGINYVAGMSDALEQLSDRIIAVVKDQP